MTINIPAGAYQFLSTPSARRATETLTAAQAEIDISIHALREEGDVPIHTSCHNRCISIHALREEGDMPAREREVSC